MTHRGVIGANILNVVRLHEEDELKETAKDARVYTKSKLPEIRLGFPFNSDHKKSHGGAYQQLSHDI